MSTPTFPQMQHFFRLVQEGKITTANFQAFLQNPASLLVGFPTTYDQSLGLMALIKAAVGHDQGILEDIPKECFPLKGTCVVRTVNLRVEPYLNGETSEQAATRLVAAGLILANIWDLAGFLHDHPDEVEKRKDWVLAISEDSRCGYPDGRVSVPCAFVDGVRRNFDLHSFFCELSSGNGVLVVSGESGI